MKPPAQNRIRKKIEEFQAKNPDAAQVAPQSLYSIELGPIFVDLMSSGLTFKAACGELEINFSTARGWVKKYKDFEDFIELGEAKRLLFYERKLADAANPATITKYIFALKSSSPEWNEKNTQTTQQEPVKVEAKVNIDLKQLSVSELEVLKNAIGKTSNGNGPKQD